MTPITYRDLRLLQLSVENVGPFRNGLEKLGFTGAVVPDTNGESRDTGPSNLFMLLARNGHGKTTLIESIYRLMQLLGTTLPEPAIDAGGGFPKDARAQLDLRMTWTVDEQTQTVLLSVWVGSPDPVVNWSRSEIDERAQASAWARVGFEWADDGTLRLASGCDELGQMLRAHILSRIGEPPTALFGEGSDLPCVLHFPANRAIFAPNKERSVVPPRDWGYRPAYRFETDGPEWGTSVDNLLVWLTWLDDERLQDLLDYLNKSIFREDRKTLRAPHRETLTSYVFTETGSHPLQDLSHGERALLQFFARTLCYMTSNTIILVDEFEIHLHTKWMNRFFQSAKTLLRDVPSLSLVFTTHNRELMKVFDHRRQEDGLIKGGFLIEEGLM